MLLAALLFGVTVLSYSCSDTRSSSAARNASSPTTASATPSPRATLLTPTVGDATVSSDSTVIGPPPGSPSGPCEDADMSLTPALASSSVPSGKPLPIVFKIKNVSAKTCTRDVGAAPQELYIQQGATKVWSSDACDPKKTVGKDDRVFGPGVETEFPTVWDGRSTAAGCGNPPFLPPGDYQVIGRLGMKLSDPAPLKVTPAQT